MEESERSSSKHNIRKINNTNLEMNVNDFAESSQKRALEANFELTIYTIFYK